MLSNRWLLGASVNVLNSSPELLDEAISTQSTGNRQYSAPSSSRTVAAGLIRRLPRPRRRSWTGDGAVAGTAGTTVETVMISPPG
jgi:hypothetical protein